MASEDLSSLVSHGTVNGNDSSPRVLSRRHFSDTTSDRRGHDADGDTSSRRRRAQHKLFLQKGKSSRAIGTRIQQDVDAGGHHGSRTLECEITAIPAVLGQAQDPKVRRRKELWAKLGAISMLTTVNSKKQDDLPVDEGENHHEEGVIASDDVEAGASSAMSTAARTRASNKKPLPPPPKQQYRFSSKKNTRNTTSRWLNLSGIQDDEQALYTASLTITSIIARYLDWTYRTTFSLLMLNFVAVYIFFTIFWAVCIMGIAVYRPICMQVGELTADELEDTATFFMDAYALSWTTFSTVGYGIVYPQISTFIHQNDARCLGMNAVMCMEAFTGILYCATCGAIVFAKIARVGSVAQVAFSDHVFIRFGTGVEDLGEDDDDNEQQGRGGADQLLSDNNNATSSNNNNFPILEFQICNNLHAIHKGEIINASITCMASIEEENASEAVLISAGVRGKKALKDCLTRDLHKVLIEGPKNIGHKFKESVKGGNNGTANGLHRLRDSITGVVPNFMSLTKHSPAASISEEHEEFHSHHHDANGGRSTAQDDHIVRETVALAASSNTPKPTLIDHGSDLVPRQIFSPLELHNDSHPLFKRVWIIRHEMNQKSPLLSSKVKHMIARNGGTWPPELNTFEKIRQSIHFQQIIVSFSGISFATGSSVYKQQVYDFETHLYVGYSMVDMLYTGQDGKLKVDDRLLNDVQEQNGGGGEPFSEHHPDALLKKAVSAVVHTAENLAEEIKDVGVAAAEEIKGAGVSTYRTAENVLKRE